MAMAGAQLREADAALRDAFALDAFDQMLRYHLDRRRQDLSLGSNFKAIVFDVLDTADREGWVPQLIAAARESNPTNARLSGFAEQWRLTPLPPERRENLERLLGSEPGYLDPTAWRERLGALEGLVGRVEVVQDAGTTYGTGWLAGPDVCVTNYHVLEPVIAGRVRPAGVTVRLDYRSSGDGTVLHPGLPVALHGTDWLVDASPPSEVDSMVDRGERLPAQDELDYAVVRLAGSPGQEPVAADRAAPDAAARGWIAGSAPLPPADSSLFLLQHPAAGPLRMAFGTVLAGNGNATRVRHLVDTEPGSSGSPCFDRDLNLVALHHSGDPDYRPEHRAQYNEAVPLATIQALLERRGLAGAVFPAGE